MPEAAPSAATPSPAPPPAKLDDMMLAMDVVDTLRHRERLVERELNEDVREEQLIERLRSLYKSQGLDVPDNVIAQGVKALKESRFVYTPPKPGFDRWLANLWVNALPSANGPPFRRDHGPCARDLLFQRGKTERQKIEAAKSRADADLAARNWARRIRRSSPPLRFPKPSKKPMRFLPKAEPHCSGEMPLKRAPPSRAWTSSPIRFARNMCCGSPDAPRTRQASIRENPSYRDGLFPRGQCGRRQGKSGQIAHPQRRDK